MAANVQGIVYLLHFDPPYKHAKHYIGWTQNLDERLKCHRSGTGARLVEVATNAGCTFDLAATWKGDRNLERRIKRLGGGRARICPICNPDAAGPRFAAPVPEVQAEPDAEAA